MASSTKAQETFDRFALGSLVESSPPPDVWDHLDPDDPPEGPVALQVLRLLEIENAKHYHGLYDLQVRLSSMAVFLGLDDSACWMTLQPGYDIFSICSCNVPPWWPT